MVGDDDDKSQDALRAQELVADYSSSSDSGSWLRDDNGGQAACAFENGQCVWPETELRECLVLELTKIRAWCNSST